MGIQIIKDGQVIVDDNKTKEEEKKVDTKDTIILDLQNQIKDLKQELRFYKIHCK